MPLYFMPFSSDVLMPLWCVCACTFFWVMLLLVQFMCKVCRCVNDALIEVVKVYRLEVVEDVNHMMVDEWRVDVQYRLGGELMI